MKNKLLTLAGALALAAVIGTYYARPLMAQVRAALVSDVDNPARNSVRLNFFVSQPEGTGSSTICFETGYTVPAGKRLVIDAFSARSFGSTSINGMYTELTSSPPASASPCGAGFFTRQTIAVFPFTVQATETQLFTRFSFAHERTQIYMDPGEILAGNIGATSFILGQAVTFRVMLNGHLVSLP